MKKVGAKERRHSSRFIEMKLKISPNKVRKSYVIFIVKYRSILSSLTLNKTTNKFSNFLRLADDSPMIRI
ncbi:MAG: hypothetical protein ACRC7K_10860, partial [Acinetobacter junii]